MSHLRHLSPIEKRVREQFCPEDAVLSRIQQAIYRDDKPAMNIGPEQGKGLQLLMAAIGASRVLEVGTFYGYSAVWIARALPAGGRLICLEVSAEHADKAGGFLAEAGLSHLVDICVGPGRELLPTLDGEAPFDLIFLDADRENYAHYLDWVERLLRPGGILAVDNAYMRGRLADPAPQPGDAYAASYAGMTALLDRLASSPQWVSTVLPFEDGLAVAVYRPG
ncbi:MAG: O-methyltransferase [Caldilineales bacterium]